MLLLAVALHTPLMAQEPGGQPRSLLPQNNLLDDRGARELADPAEERARISRREASDIAREKFSGRVLSIRLDESHWRVRMDQEGTVFNVLVDAESGSASRAQD
jgi:uncharacterized membrane protein YkoI